MGKETKEDEIIALATVYQDGTTVRGKIPNSVVKALRAKDGDVLVFERQSDGAVRVRKSNASERKGLASKKGGKK